MGRATGIGLLGALACLCVIVGSGCNVTRLQGDLNSERKRTRQLTQDRFDLERDLNVSKGVEEGLKEQITELTVQLQTLRGQLNRAQRQGTGVVPVSGEEGTPQPAIDRQLDRATPSGPTGFESLQSAGVQARWEQDGTLRVTLPDGLFGAGRAQLSKKGTDLVGSVCSQISGAYAGRKVVVEGHTDNTPVTKVKERFPSNWELSSARAGAVLRALVEKGEVSAADSYIIGFGANRPLASNDSKAGRRANRRVELLIAPR